MEGLGLFDCVQRHTARHQAVFQHALCYQVCINLVSMVCVFGQRPGSSECGPPHRGASRAGRSPSTALDGNHGRRRRCPSCICATVHSSTSGQQTQAQYWHLRWYAFSFPCENCRVCCAVDWCAWYGWMQLLCEVLTVAAVAKDTWGTGGSGVASDRVQVSPSRKVHPLLFVSGALGVPLRHGIG
jgi:hypothetical protein